MKVLLFVLALGLTNQLLNARSFIGDELADDIELGTDDGAFKFEVGGNEEDNDFDDTLGEATGNDEFNEDDEDEEDDDNADESTGGDLDIATGTTLPEEEENTGGVDEETDSNKTDEEDETEEETDSSKSKHGLSDEQVEDLCQKYNNGEINDENEQTKQFLQNLCEEKEEDKDEDNEEDKGVEKVCKYKHGQWCLDDYVKKLQARMKESRKRINMVFKFFGKIGCKGKKHKSGNYGHYGHQGKWGMGKWKKSGWGNHKWSGNGWGKKLFWGHWKNH